jgi:hypothetical protein
MLQNIILFGCSLLSIYFSVSNLKKQNQYISKMSMLTSFLQVCVAAPLVEESIFRSVLKNALVNVEYNNYINAILFGLMHASNYIYNKNIYQCVFQVAITTFLGYICVIQNNFLSSYLIHMGYNSFITLFSYLIFGLSFIKINTSTFCEVTLNSHILWNKKAKDDSNVKYYKEPKKVENISCILASPLIITENKMKPDMLVRIKLLKQMQEKRCKM